ncbi:MAG: FUSC family protein [Bacillota bacterium]
MVNINKRGALEIVISILPGIIFTWLTGRDYYLIASFFAVCALIPYNKSYFNRYYSFIHLVLIFAIGELMANAMQSGEYWLYAVIMGTVGLICGYLELNNPSLRKAASWIMIGTIYSSFKFPNIPASQYTAANLISILLLAAASLALALLVNKPKSAHINYNFKFSSRDCLLYFRIVFPVLIAFIVWRAFDIQEAEWLLWSSISVANIELEAAKTKAKHRLLGGAAGIILGFAVALILPASQLLNYVLFTCMMLTFRVFDKYYISFTARCFFIVLYANNHFMIGCTRITNVLIGAVIGYLCSLVLIKLQQRQSIY